MGVTFSFLQQTQLTIPEFNSFDQRITKNLPPVSVSKTFPVFSKSLSCAGPPTFDSSITADVTANANAVIALGMAAAGTVVPPRLTDFGLFAGMDAQLDGTLGLKGNVAVCYVLVSFLGASF